MQSLKKAKCKFEPFKCLFQLSVQLQNENFIGADPLQNQHYFLVVVIAMSRMITDNVHFHCFLCRTLFATDLNFDLKEA